MSFTTLKSKITNLALVLMLAVPLFVAGVTPTASAAFDSKSAACEGVGLGNSPDCGSANAGNKINNTVSSIVNILSVVVGIAAVIMIIIAGFKYVTSNGDANKIASAKSTLIYALVGLVIVALAQFLVHFVLTNV